MKHPAWSDFEREESEITDVVLGDTMHEVTSSNGWSCGVSTEYGVEPKVGDRFVTWGSTGFPIRGQAINDRVLFYRTPAEQDVENAKRIAAQKAERVGEYESKRSEHDARVNALPAPLRERVEGFRAHGGDEWRWNFEPYEMACCEEAARIAERFKTGPAIQAFSKLEHAEQKAAHPNMDSGHSGNTWGMSVRLAWLLAERPELVPQEHGAMCALVGCEEYGCYAARKEAAA